MLAPPPWAIELPNGGKGPPQGAQEEAAKPAQPFSLKLSDRVPALHASCTTRRRLLGGASHAVPQHDPALRGDLELALLYEASAGAATLQELRVA